MTIELVQGSAEWRQARCGKVTASRVGDATARSKKNGEWLASRANYMAELIIERLTGQPAEQYVSTAMQWGTDHEPQARELYALMTDSVVTEVGFVPHPEIAYSGCSPDGLIGDDGLVQFKCPNSSTHIETLLGAKIDLCYVKQMQFEMAVTERCWSDFVSFDPRMPGGLQLFIKRFERDDKMIVELEKDILCFLKELDTKVANLHRRYGGNAEMETAA